MYEIGKKAVELPYLTSKNRKGRTAQLFWGEKLNPPHLTAEFPPHSEIAHPTHPTYVPTPPIITRKYSMIIPSRKSKMYATVH
jgi:hypothetical protein